MDRGQILRFFIGSGNPIMKAFNYQTETSMKPLLQIQTSMFAGGGQSSRLAQEFVAEWRKSNRNGRVIVRDIGAEPIPHLTAERFQSFLAAPEARTAEQHAVAGFSDNLIDELRQADVIVLGLPMYNFGVPSPPASSRTCPTPRNAKENSRGTLVVFRCPVAFSPHVASHFPATGRAPRLIRFTRAARSRRPGDPGRNSARAFHGRGARV